MRNVNNLRYADNTTLMAESEEELESLLKISEEADKAGLKLNIHKMKIMASSPTTSWKQMGKQWKQWQTLLSWGPKSLQMVTAAIKLKDTCSLKKSYDQPRQHIKKQRHYFANKSLSSQSYGFSSSHVRVVMWDHKEIWVPKNWCFWTVMLEKTLESPLDCKVIQPFHPKGNQCRLFIGSTHTEAPILWCEELTCWKRPWCWERLKVGGEGDDRGWDGWMTSPNQWTWIWASSGSWWWTGKPGMLWSLGSQRVAHDWATELKWQWWFGGNKRAKKYF